MKVCEILDETNGNAILGYLFYYEKNQLYSIEISGDLTEDEAPVFFTWFIRNDVRTVSPEWSRRWVESRVIPPDRQNLGMILKEYKLKEYNVFKLLMISDGRCAQDDCAVKPVKYEELPGWVLDRRQKKLEFAVDLGSWNMIFTYRDGSVFRVDMYKLLDQDDKRCTALDNPLMKNEYKITAGGTGLMIGGSVIITSEELYGHGQKLPLTGNELRILAGSYVMDTRDVCNELNCSRQYIDELTKKKGLSVLKDGGTHIYARSDVNKVTE